MPLVMPLHKLLTVARSVPVPPNCWFACWTVSGVAPRYKGACHVAQYTDQDAAYTRCVEEGAKIGNSSLTDLVQVVNGTETRMWVASRAISDLPIWQAGCLVTWEKDQLELIRGRLLSNCEGEPSESCLTK